MFVGAFFKNEEYSHTICACLFVLDSSLDRSGKKNLELDLILFILRSSRKRLGRSDFILRANRLSVRAKGVPANRTSGETGIYSMLTSHKVSLYSAKRPASVILTSSETQGLLAGTTRYFWAKIYFKS